MSWTPREIGTLIVVILKARHLPNKRHIGKQDPYCSIVYNGEKRRTKAIKRGGQHPEWDEEVRFTLYEDLEDELARTATDGDAPPPPPKNGGKLKIKGGKNLRISCFADDPREPDLIGETNVDLTEVLTTGETDEWFSLTHKERYCGDVYLELTFWSNEPEPEKKETQKVAKPSKHYGGAGSFIPAGSMPSTLTGGPGGRHGSSRHASTGNISLDHTSNPAPPSLRASTSLASINLYVAPYEQNTARTYPPGVSPVDQIVGEFAEMNVHGHRSRAESFPGMHGSQGSHTPRPPSPDTYGYPQGAYHSQNFHDNSYPESSSIYGYDQPVTPTSYSHYGAAAGYQGYYDSGPPQPSSFGVQRSSTHRGPRYSLPSSSSGFVPISTPAPSGFMPIPSHSTGGAGYTSPSTASSIYMQGYAPTPAPPEFPYSTSGPIHTSNAMSYAPQAPYHPPPQSSFQHSRYPPPPASAPPQAHLPPPTPVGVPSPSHSAPPQAYHDGSGGPHPAMHEYMPVPPPPPITATPAPNMPSSGSRPLPLPQVMGQPSPHRQSSLPMAPIGTGMMPYNLPNPPPPPPNFTSTPIPPPPPPPPPSQFQSPNNGAAYATDGQYGLVPPPPPPPPVSQFHGAPSPTRPSLPQPPVAYSSTLSAYPTVPPPPPLPTPPNGQSYHPGPLPRPPAHNSSQWAPLQPLATGSSY